MHHFRIFETLSGDPVEDVTIPEPYLGQWDTRLTGRGVGRYGIPLYGSGISRSLAREISRGNRYIFAHLWGEDDLVIHSGVIQRRRYQKKIHGLEIITQEIRGAYLNDRMMYGVPGYVRGESAIDIVDKSHSGAVRQIFEQWYSYFWYLCIDLPADGSGGFSHNWDKDERLKGEDHLAQIEKDGCEIFFRPYVNGSGQLWHETIVQDPVVEFGTTTAVDVDAKDSPILDLETVDDYMREMTGLLGFGKGGLAAPTAWAGDVTPSGISVRDSWRNYPDLDGDRLQNAVDNDFAVMKDPIEQWAFSLNISPDGPAHTLPGRKLQVDIADDLFIEDGPHAMRVIGLSGDLGYTVTPEVQRVA